MAAFLLLLVAAGWVYLATLPGVGDAESRVDAIVIEHGGHLLSAPPPARVADAVVSTEDENFYDGVIPNVASGVGRAALAALEERRRPGRQHDRPAAGEAPLPPRRRLVGTLEEIGLGIKLSLHYSHEQVLDMYLNSIYYGNGYWGVVAASRGYFGTSPRRLTWGEASLLAGLPQAPSAYDPIYHLPLARLRQRHVLDQLVANGYLTSPEADAAFREPLPLRPG